MFTKIKFSNFNWFKLIFTSTKKIVFFNYTFIKKEFCINRLYLFLQNSFKIKMAPRRGLEPPAYRLTAECSTIELSRNIIATMKFKVAPRRGLEPPAYRLTAECSTIELSRNIICNNEI